VLSLPAYGPPPSSKVSEVLFSNEALSVALLSPANPWNQWLLRAGAMLLSHPANEVRRIVDYARWERWEAVVRSIAEAGQRYEPQNAFWTDLLQTLPPAAACKDSVLPHHSRYVLIPGKIGLGKMASPVWLRPKRLPALGYAA